MIAATPHKKYCQQQWSVHLSQRFLDQVNAAVSEGFVNKMNSKSCIALISK
jgi:hypothetical protein